MSKKLVEQIVDGQKISPGLPEGMKNFMIDIDGTICDDIPNEEPERMATAKVFDGALETINKWYELGHVITFFTSRIEEHREVTEEWLDMAVKKETNLMKEWVLPQDMVYFNKIPYGMYHILTKLKLKGRFQAVFDKLFDELV